MSFNCEGFQSTKAELLSKLALENDITIILLQETHRSAEMERPKIGGFTLVKEAPHKKHGSAIFMKE